MRSLHFVVAAAALASAAAPLCAQQQREQRDTTSRARREQAIVRAMRAADTVGEGRAVLGVSTQSSGARDSLGLLIVEVVPGGPADKAGLQEGDRIMSVNDVNLKLASGDAGQPDMSGLTTRRLVRELDKVKAGDNVKLSVYADGRTKSVTLKTARASDVYKGELGRGFRLYFGGVGAPPVPPMPPTPPVPPLPPARMRELRSEIDRIVPLARAEARAAAERSAVALRAARSLRCQCQE